MRIKSFDGAHLAVKILGEGRPVVLVHGFLSSAKVNWEDYGTADALVKAGFQVIMPDLRGHGSSDVPLDAGSYPPDVLALDLVSIVRNLGLTDYDLVGYSLGARTIIRAVAEHGLQPRRIVIGGMGIIGITAGHPRVAWFIEAIRNRDNAKPLTPEGRVARFLKTTGAHPDAAIMVLASHMDTSREALGRITQPVLVLSGVDDHDHGSPAELAAAMPNGRYVEVPGDHMSCITMPEFRAAIAEFMSA